MYSIERHLNRFTCFSSLDEHGVEELSAQKRGNASWNV
jgi:hypothetical protein